MRIHPVTPFVIAAVAAIAAVVSCKKTPEPDTSSAPLPATPPAAQTSAASPHGAAGPSTHAGPTDVGWDAPGSWQKAENPSPMRKATYKIPHAAGDAEDAEMSVSQAGGSIEMNIQRWKGQFEKSPPPTATRTEKTIGDLTVTIVEIHGTFLGSGMPGAPPGPPKPAYAMLAAIVETATPTFFKLTGPEKTVVAAKPDFEKMVDGMRAK